MLMQYRVLYRLCVGILLLCSFLCTQAKGFVFLIFVLLRVTGRGRKNVGYCEGSPSLFHPPRDYRT